MTGRNEKVSTLLAQETPPPLPPREWKERGKSKATELEFSTFTERMRDTAMGGRAGAFRIVSEHAAVEAPGRFADVIATAQIIEMLCEVMGCTSLVAPNQEPKADSDDWWERHWWRTTRKT